jgi:hypothetical protein
MLRLAWASRNAATDILCCEPESELYMLSPRGLGVGVESPGVARETLEAFDWVGDVVAGMTWRKDLRLNDELDASTLALASEALLML